MEDITESFCNLNHSLNVIENCFFVITRHKFLPEKTQTNVLKVVVSTYTSNVMIEGMISKDVYYFDNQSNVLLSFTFLAGFTTSQVIGYFLHG